MSLSFFFLLHSSIPVLIIYPFYPPPPPPPPFISSSSFILKSLPCFLTLSNLSFLVLSSFLSSSPPFFLPSHLFYLSSSISPFFISHSLITPFLTSFLSPFHSFHLPLVLQSLPLFYFSFPHQSISNFLFISLPSPFLPFPPLPHRPRIAQSHFRISTAKVSSVCLTLPDNPSLKSPYFSFESCSLSSSSSSFFFPSSTPFPLLILPPPLLLLPPPPPPQRTS